MAVAQAEAAQKAAQAAAASAEQAVAALAEAKAAQEEAEAAQTEAEATAAEAERLRLAAQAATALAEQQSSASDAARDRAEQEREEAEQLVNQAQAKATYAGLGHALVGTNAAADEHDSPANGLATNNPVTPRYRATTLVTANPAVTFSSSQRSSSGRWAVTTLSNAGQTHNDDLVVYSDLGGPTRVPIAQKYTFTDLDAEDATALLSKLIDDSGDDAELITSGSFPSAEGVDKEFTYNFDGDDDNNPMTTEDDRVRISGRYDGATGNFECTATGNDTCTVTRLGNRYVVEGTWTFYTRKSSTVLLDDDSYMYFGWWRREDKANESFSFSTFSDGMHKVTSGSDPSFTDVVGSVTYEGPAVGQYAIYQPLGSQSGTGSFTARARLEANFGDTNTNGTLSGQVTNFSNASDWSLTLSSQTISATGAVTRGGTVSWTIAGNTEEGGEWDAQLFSESTYGGQVPEGVSGGFEAQFSDVGRLIGAYGAHKW